MCSRLVMLLSPCLTPLCICSNGVSAHAGAIVISLYIIYSWIRISKGQVSVTPYPVSLLITYACVPPRQRQKMQADAHLTNALCLHLVHTHTSACTVMRYCLWACSCCQAVLVCICHCSPAFLCNRQTVLYHVYHVYCIMNTRCQRQTILYHSWRTASLT